MAKNNVAILFQIEEVPYMTVINAQSKAKFEKLIKDYATRGSIITNPEEDQQFTHTPYHKITTKILVQYCGLKGTRLEHTLTAVTKLVNSIGID